MKLTTEQKIGLFGALLCCVSGAYAVGSPHPGPSALFLVLPSLVSGFFIYKYPDPQTISRTGCLLSAAAVLFYAFVAFESEEELVVPAVVASIGVVMWVLASFPKTLQQEV